MAFSEACYLGFSPGTPVSSPSSLVNGLTPKNKAKIDAILTVEFSSRAVSLYHNYNWNLVAELSLCITIVTVEFSSRAVPLYHNYNCGIW